MSDLRGTDAIKSVKAKEELVKRFKLTTRDIDLVIVAPASSLRAYSAVVEHAHILRISDKHPG